MGIVAKQSILNTIYTYVGFLFGALNTLFLFTYIFNKTDYGLVTYLMTTGNLLWPFLALGMHNTIIKFYHSFESPSSKNRFFSWILLIPIITSLLILFTYFIFNQRIHSYFENANTVVSPYVWIILVLGFSTAYFELFFAWAKIHLKSVTGNFIKAVFLRILISILLLLVYFDFLSIPQFIYTLGISYVLRAILMGIIAYQIQTFKLQLKTVGKVKEILTYSFLILVASVVATYLLDLDKVMIEYFRPIEELPAYSIAIYIASVIAVPARALLQITTPLTAKFINQKEHASLNDLNKKSSINGLLISGIVAVLILTNTHSIFALVPNNYTLFIEIVFCIALVRVFDASLGITNGILLNSHAYKWILVFGIGILILAFGLNIALIPKYGIVGAAIATFIAYTIFNSIKLIFVKKYFNIQPYQLKSLGIFFLLVLIGTIFYSIQFDTLSPILNILIKGTLTSFVFILLLLKLKLSPDIAAGITKLLKH